MNKNTELPWFIDLLYSDSCIIGAKTKGINVEVATVWGDGCEKDAEYIVKACNLFPELVEALEGIIDEADNHGGGSDTMSEVLLEIQRSAKNILKKAKE